MTLSEFMTLKSLDDAAMARLLDKNRVTVNRYRRGIEVPSTTTILRIIEISGGLVSANDLLGIQQEGAT